MKQIFLKLLILAALIPSGAFAAAPQKDEQTTHEQSQEIRRASQTSNSDDSIRDVGSNDHKALLELEQELGRTHPATPGPAGGGGQVTDRQGNGL